LGEDGFSEIAEEIGCEGGMEKCMQVFGV